MVTKKVLTSIKKYGSSSLSFSSVQDDLNYFFLEDGFIAYKKVEIFYNTIQYAVLGDPVCSKEKKHQLLKQFILNHSNSYFVQINKCTKKHLETLNFNIFPFGSEHIIELNKHCISWKKKAVKKSINWQKKHQLTIIERKRTDILFWERVNELKIKWKSKKRLLLEKHGFLNRPLKMKKKEKDIRYFYLEKNKKTISFIRCDPIYENNIIFAYSISYIMYDQDFKKNLTYGIINQLIDKLKKEKNIKFISLGVTPYSYKNKAFTSLYINILQKSLYYLGSYFYNFKDLKSFKEKISTNSTKTYFASKQKLPIKDILTTYVITTGIKIKSL